MRELLDFLKGKGNKGKPTGKGGKTIPTKSAQHSINDYVPVRKPQAQPRVEPSKADNTEEAFTGRLDDDINLDGFGGSGSGLLDPTLPSDDTQFGDDLFNDVFPATQPRIEQGISKEERKTITKYFTNKGYEIKKHKGATFYYKDNIAFLVAKNRKVDVIFGFNYDGYAMPEQAKDTAKKWRAEINKIYLSNGRKSLPFAMNPDKHQVAVGYGMHLDDKLGNENLSKISSDAFDLQAKVMTYAAQQENGLGINGAKPIPAYAALKLQVRNSERLISKDDTSSIKLAPE